MTRKWRKIVAIGRKRITSPRTNRKMDVADHSNKSLFSLSSDGSITLPCDSAIMNYIVLLVQRRIAKDLEKVVLLVTVIAAHHTIHFSMKDMLTNSYLFVGSHIYSQKVFMPKMQANSPYSLFT
ncbi:hypothetical protein REPUB_Repub11eG0068200 [Reevesia pubescens]